jgi:hypothetical protein
MRVAYCALQSGISVGDAEVYAFSFLVLLFVVLMEVWHYLIRLRTKFWLQYLSELKSRYVLEKR